MSVFARTRSFWRHVLHRSDLERAMSDELQFHIQQRADDLAATRGLAPGEAMRLARLEFGSVDKYKEEARRSVGLRLLDEWRGDVRYACRMLRHNRGFAAAAIATLAIGIGANTAIFSVINALLLRPLPVERPHELVSLLMQRPAREPRSGFTFALWEAVRDQQDVFASTFAWSTPKTLEFAQGSTARPVQLLMVSGEFFNALGVAPAAGRLLGPFDDRPGCTPMAVLSHAFWSEQFGHADRVLGSTITLSQQAFQVIGVSRPGFSGVDVGKRFDVAIPLCASALLDKRNVESRGRWWLGIIGRLKPGISPTQADARLRLQSAAIAAASLPDGPPSFQSEFLKTTLVTRPAGTGDSDLRRAFTEPLRVLMVMVVVVVVIASANIAGLLLARAATRQKEVAIRAALGASRGRLIRQLLTEAALLSALGAVLGLLLARWGGTLLLHGLSTSARPLYLDLSPDGRVLGQTIVVAMATALMVGLLPARRATRPAVIDAMKTKSPAGARHSGFRLGRWIVTAQVALSLVLLVAGALLLRTFVNLVTQDVGFDRRNVLVISARAPWFASDAVKLRPEQKPVIHDELIRRLRSIPGVVSATRSYTSPIGDDNWMTEVRTEVPGAPTGRDATTYLNFVMPGYFQTLRTPLLSGRDFSELDVHGGPPVAIVNETMARRFFPGAQALGGRFRKGRDQVWVEVIGVVRDTKYESVRKETPPTAFLPLTQLPPDEFAEEFVLRTAMPPANVIGAARQVSADVSRDLVLSFRTMEQRIDDDLVQERLVAVLAGLFGVAGVLLAMVGLYGVLSYLVTERQVEFGIRMAIGSSPGAVRRLVMRDVTTILAVGLVTGLAATLPGMALLERLVFGLGTRDATTLAAAAAMLAMAVGLAGYLPARRATRIDPVAAMRSE